MIFWRIIRFLTSGLLIAAFVPIIALMGSSPWWVEFLMIFGYCSLFDLWKVAKDRCQL